MLIEQQLMLLFTYPALFRLFLFLFPAFLFLLPFVCFTGLQQGCGVESEGLEHADGEQLDKRSFFRTLKRIRNPVPAISGGFLPAVFPVEEPAGILPAGEAYVFNLADHMETVLVLIPVFILFRQLEIHVLGIRFQFHIRGHDGITVRLVSEYFCFHLTYFLIVRSYNP